MSKIEKALHRARGERNLQIVPQTGTHPPASTQRALLPVPAQRANAAHEIALMREPQLRDRSALDQERIIYPEMLGTGTVQAFREIRTKLIQRSGGRNCSVAVTAVDSSSGTSFVAFNLGVAFAFDAAKTALVMDCNRTNPSLHRLAIGENPLGITDYLEDANVDIEQIMYSVGIPRLRVMPAGANLEAPAEYFTTGRMHDLMQDIKHRYAERYLIVDAPPMTQFADVQVLMEFCDYAILVVPYGKVTESAIADAARAIGEQKLLGVVFNNEPRPPEGTLRDGLRRSLLGRFVGLFFPRAKRKH